VHPIALFEDSDFGPRVDLKHRHRKGADAQPVTVVPERPGTVVQIAASRLTIVVGGAHVKVTVLAGCPFRFRRPKPDRRLVDIQVGQIFS
jgi:hypothetical protein